MNRMTNDSTESYAEMIILQQESDDGKDWFLYWKNISPALLLDSKRFSRAIGWIVPTSQTIWMRKLTSM